MANSILAAQLAIADMTEEWAPVREYEGFYEVCSSGKVRSVDRQITRKDGAVRRLKGRELSGALCNHGYISVTLAKSGVNRGFLIHRLVADAFLARSSGQDEVNHKDGDKTNNDARNLEWCTRSENIQHSVRIGLFTRLVGSQKPASKLTETDVVEIRKMLLSGALVKEIAAHFGVSTAPISYIKNGKAWNHV